MILLSLRWGQTSHLIDFVYRYSLHSCGKNGIFIVLFKCSHSLHAVLGKQKINQTTIVQNNKVHVGKDQEKAQSEKDSHSKYRGRNTKLTSIRYLYHKNIS